MIVGVDEGHVVAVLTMVEDCAAAAQVKYPCSCPLAKVGYGPSNAADLMMKQALEDALECRSVDRAKEENSFDVFLEYRCPWNTPAEAAW